jgi:hypothetical protein
VTFQNKFLRITKLPRETPIATLHEQTGMSYQEVSEGCNQRNSQIQELGHYDPTADKYLHSLSLLAR